MVVNRIFPGVKQRTRLNRGNSALTYAFDGQAAKEGLMKIWGNGARPQELLGMRDDFNPIFEVVTSNPVPRRP